jgi:hypothetical protein
MSDTARAPDSFRKGLVDLAVLIGFGSLTLLGMWITLATFIFDLPGSDCTYTACDPQHAVLTLAIWAPITLGFLVGMVAWGIVRRVRRRAVWPIVLLLFFGETALCYSAFYFYSAGGGVNF